MKSPQRPARGRRQPLQRGAGAGFGAAAESCLVGGRGRVGGRWVRSQYLPGPRRPLLMKAQEKRLLARAPVRLAALAPGSGLRAARIDLGLLRSLLGGRSLS